MFSQMGNFYVMKEYVDPTTTLSCDHEKEESGWTDSQVPWVFHVGMNSNSGEFTFTYDASIVPDRFIVTYEDQNGSTSKFDEIIGPTALFGDIVHDADSTLLHFSGQSKVITVTILPNSLGIDLSQVAQGATWWKFKISCATT